MVRAQSHKFKVGRDLRECLNPTLIQKLRQLSFKSLSDLPKVLQLIRGKCGISKQIL